MIDKCLEDLGQERLLYPDLDDGRGPMKLMKPQESETPIWET